MEGQTIQRDLVKKLHQIEKQLFEIRQHPAVYSHGKDSPGEDLMEAMRLVVRAAIKLGGRRISLKHMDKTVRREVTLSDDDDFNI